MSHGSAMSFTLESTGSCRQLFRKPPPSSKPCGSRARIVARSKRKPSTRISVTQYRRLSVTICSTRGWLRLTVLPVPVSLM
ncbi:Uncharacterised protein [Mycobacterium tuberculosis]|nr:Uncharacterised protein [Mycobacterium tuberculosis]